MPAPNGGFVSGAIAGQIFVIGGTNWEGGTKQWLSEIHTLSCKDTTWKTEGQKALIAYAVAGLTDQGKVLSIVGGTIGTGPSEGRIEVSPGRVDRKPHTLGTPAVLSAGGVIGSQMIVVGGNDDPANIAGLKNQALVMNLQDGTVEKLPDYPGKPFGSAASVVSGKELFIFGGAHWTGEAQLVINTDAAYAISVESKQWRKLRSFPYAVRGLTAVALDGDRLYLGGGYKTDAEGFTAEAFIYDIAADTYTPAKPLPYKAGVGLVICDGFLYCLGGEDKQKSRTDACYRIPLASLVK